MTTYELLDHIADSVNPTLGLLALLLPWLKTYRSRGMSAWIRVAGALICVGVAYTGRAVDTLTGAWPAVGLDYSGHTAVCVALLMSLAQLSSSWLIASIGIGISYAALMMYQRYHTFADIVTTGIPVGLGCAVLWWAIHIGTRVRPPARTLC